MDEPKRIILEDTGERRFPKDWENYLYLPSGLLFNCEGLNESTAIGKPEDFAILRTVQNDFAPECP